jgi:ArsR family transcriptional regulator, virulence genes transcriptional regulator
VKMEDRRREAEAFRIHAELCKSLTDPKRLMILQALRAGERSVGDLADTLGMTLANASQHLSVMRHAEMVATRRDGTTVFYSLAEPRIVEACDIVHQIVLDRMGRGRYHRPQRAATVAGVASERGSQGPRAHALGRSEVGRRSAAPRAAAPSSPT